MLGRLSIIAEPPQAELAAIAGWQHDWGPAIGRE